MSNNTVDLRRKISGAGELQGVVRAMKALAGSSIGQYEKAVAALGDYAHALELSLGVCLREAGPPLKAGKAKPMRHPIETCAVVFGSDQGLVGQFNGLVSNFALKSLSQSKGSLHLWAVGERVNESLADSNLAPEKSFPVPASVEAIVPLAGEILLATEALQGGKEGTELLLFFNQPLSSSAFAPAKQRLLPLDQAWARHLADQPWPSKVPAQILGNPREVMRALIRGYLFVSLFKACAESLASENASRLAAMQRADKNIDDRLEELRGSFHRLRQGGIDEELFDVLSGFEALNSGVET